MRTSFTWFVALALGSPMIFAAELLPVEQSIEATSQTVSIPAPTGLITARSCGACPARTLRLDVGTRFYIAEAPVTFDQFKRSLDRSPAPSLTIHFRAEDNTVTRVVVSAQ